MTDLFFRPFFAFFLIELKTRKVIPVGVTRSPTDAWVAATSGIKILKTPYHAPRAKAICERYLRSVRQECLDHLLILHEGQLQRVLNAYVVYFNQAWPHQGIHQQIPEPGRSALSSHQAYEKIIAFPVMGGLHHDYRWAA